MKKITSIILVLFAILAFSNRTNAQSLDIENFDPDIAGFNVTYCGVSLFVPGASGGTPGTNSAMNPCPTAPPCSINVSWGSGLGCSFTVNFPICPVAGVPFDTGLFSVSTGCAVPTLKFRITIDAAGNARVRIYL